MSNSFIQTEIDKVLNSTSFPQNSALAAAWIIAHFKGINIKIIDSKKTSSLCDYNIIASAENTMQAKSMADQIVRNMRASGMTVISQEGLEQAEWILIDLGDIIVHIFQDVCRHSYDLDGLWSDQPLVKIPQEFYFGQAADSASNSTASTEQYF
jgi:ribosome-associated protein